ncbi:unnamed protein product, partial [Allacma fusca]
MSLQYVGLRISSATVSFMAGGERGAEHKRKVHSQRKLDGKKANRGS